MHQVPVFDPDGVVTPPGEDDRVADHLIRSALMAESPLLIDCHQCVLQHTTACADCVVTFICRTDANSPVVVDLAEVRAIKMLDTAGLVPPLRHQQGATGTD